MEGSGQAYQQSAQLVGSGNLFPVNTVSVIQAASAMDITSTTEVVSPPVEEILLAEFRRLADQWREETRFSSNITANLMHPAYQRIMAMGKPALPLILKELEVRGGHWFHALHYLVRENEDPVPPEHYAKIKQMREDWLQWGRLNHWL